MRLSSVLLLGSSIILGSISCVEEPNPALIPPPTLPPPPPPSIPGLLDQRTDQLLANEVGPALATTCGSADCHGQDGHDPRFVSETPALIHGFHDQLFPGYSSVAAPLLEYGADGSHHGARFTAFSALAIQYWLAMQAWIRPFEDSAVSPMRVWAGCLDYEQFLASGVAEAWAEKMVGDYPCSTCHASGQNGFIASDDASNLFAQITREPRHMISYFVLDPTGTMIINTERLQRAGEQRSPNVNHPTFAIDDEAMERLETLYQQTVARQNAGVCLPPPPTFAVPPQ